MLIVVPVQVDAQFDPVSKMLRTEDIRDYMEDVYDKEQTIISFYEDIEPLTIQEDFETFHKRFSEIEVKYYDSDEGKGDELIL